jgi:heme/copper-type cytochrome/quinol oxidase subunit 1
MYLWFSFTMFLFGGTLALALRLSCFSPDLQFWRPEFFNQLTTMHGLIMVFGAIMPAFVGFANWQVPMMVGAPDMAFARMNNFSFWLLPPAALLLVASFFRSRWRHSGRLDVVRAADGANGSGHGPRHLRAAHFGCELDHGLDQHHHDDS